MTILHVSVHERNWADLPRELLGLIIDRLIDFPDYIRFGAVCKNWLCEARIAYQERRRKWSPMLLIPVGDNDKDQWRLYSIWEKKLYPHRPFQVPYHQRCSGSSYGWLAFADKDDSYDVSIKLLNPFSGSTINLPPIMNILDWQRSFLKPEYFIHRVILSCDPSLHPEDWVAAAVHDVPKTVAFIRAGESSWTYLTHYIFPVDDVCFYKGQLCAINCIQKLIAIDLSDYWSHKNGRDVTMFERLVSAPNPLGNPLTMEKRLTMSYLVEWDKELLLVLRFYLNRCYPDNEDHGNVLATIEHATINKANNNGKTTVGFKPFKLNHIDDLVYTAAKWVEIHNLGNFSLFLGGSESISLFPSNFANMQPNCFYYTDGYMQVAALRPYEANDMGIFDLATGKISHYYALEPSQRYMPPAVWILPKTC